MRDFFPRHGFLQLVTLSLAAALFGCASRPEAPVMTPLAADAAARTTERLSAVLPADVLLLGEQHDAAEHQRIHQQVIATLASRGMLAAVVLEMADVGASTAALKPSATEAEAQAALKWNEAGWPWAAYGPAIMAAVRAEVPVVGGNLPRERMRDSMAEKSLDGQLPGPALKAQQQLIRIGHCGLLPESQITPMTRIQIAKDISMAKTLAQSALPGKVALLLAGSVHVDRSLGVPQHLPPELKARSILLKAGEGASTAAPSTPAFDSTWSTPQIAAVDYCAGLADQLRKGSGGMQRP
ncbi:MAG: ChaN family lipoprotein [Pseudomonadota bacterium]